MNLLLSISFNGIFNSLTGGVAQGLTWGLLAIAVYISFRILNTADMTVDGSLALGGVLTAVLISCGWHFILAMIVAVISSALAGAITGILHTKLKIPAILAGILTMSALYSVNMALMSGKSSIAILEFNTLKTMWG
ncbi:MAG: ABC transporter permease, partial [Clostridia bacterium]